MPSFLSILQTLLPIFGVILLGAAFKRTRFLDEGFWPQAERLTYYFLFPALLFRSTATASLDPSTLGSLAMAVYGATLTLGLALLLVRGVVARDPAAFTSVFQGSIRFNTYIGLSAAFGLFGRAGLDLGSVLIGGLIPLVNVLSVAVLARYAGSPEGGSRTIALSILRNPLIIASLAGLAVNGAGWSLPRIPDEFLLITGRASLPVGLLAVGAAMEFRTVRGSLPTLLGTCGLKLILLPGLVALACALLDVQGLPRTIAVLFTALPGSPLAFILARQMGGDFRLMANIVTLQVMLSMITLPWAIRWAAS